MSAKAAAEIEELVPADDFHALEEKIFRTIEMLKAAREAQAAAERESRRLREQMQDGHGELDSLRREAIALRREREEVRARVEKMLKQLDTLEAASTK